MSAINIVFDGPPAPNAGRFVEVENDEGQSIRIGEWVEGVNGYWSLRIDKLPGTPSKVEEALRRMLKMHEKMMDKVNHGASFYDAECLAEMNEAPAQAREALK